MRRHCLGRRPQQKLSPCAVWLQRTVDDMQKVLVADGVEPARPAVHDVFRQNPCVQIRHKPVWPMRRRINLYRGPPMLGVGWY